MNTNDLPEPICHKCLEPMRNEPLCDAPGIWLCDHCFEEMVEEEEAKDRKKRQKR